MDIAVASGKGGTGKTTVAVTLASWCSREKRSVALLDCDVEEPNADLFLRSSIEREEQVDVLIPLVNAERCTACGECENICAFSAILLLKGKPLVLPDMCHSCGGCFLVCPEGAITEVPRTVGSVSSGKAGDIRYAGGLLKIGEPMAPPVIKATKKLCADADIRIIDCPPGTSCPVIESVRGSDFIILVTEPTPFGLNDLVLAVEMCRAMGLPFGVVINRDGIGNSGVRKYCAAENISILASIPYSRKLAEAYSRGDAIPAMLEAYSSELESVMNQIEKYSLKV